MMNKSSDILQRILLIAVASTFAVRSDGQQAQPNAPSAIARSVSPRQSAVRSKGVANARNPSPAMPAIPYDDNPNGLNFQEAAADLVIMDYAIRTGLTVIKDPATPSPLITLRSTPENPLTDEQYLTAIETVLNLNGIALVKDGTFLRVYPGAEIRQRGIETTFVTDAAANDAKLPEHGQFVSRMIELRNIDITEAKSVIEGFVRSGAKIQTFERSNSILVTDSVDNVNRIVEIIGYIDRPVVAHEESHIINIKYAKAADIKERLLEIVRESQDSDAEKDKKKHSAAQERSAGPPGTISRRLPPGVTLPSRGIVAERHGPVNETVESLIADAQRGIIRGRVSIFSDDRTNLLIIITRPENMIFFNKIIDVLDVPTAPEFVVEVLRLEHAVAEDVAKLLNELISNESSKSESDNKLSLQRGKENVAESDEKSADRETGGRISSETKNKIGQLDAKNIKILADERTNAIIIMSSYNDMMSIKQIVGQMDIMLSQVVIETVIISVMFADSNETGMDWVQRAMLSGEGKDGDSPAIAFATAGGGGTLTPKNTLSLVSTGDLTTPDIKGGANFVATLFDFNVDLILRAIRRDNRSRLMSSPRITTLDNKEAVLESTDRIYWKEGTTYYAHSDYTSENIKNEDVGIKLTVTPRINKNGYITLTIEQEIQTNDGFTMLNGSNYPNLNTRKMGADVAVQSGQTVVLGGLAQNAISSSQTKVPILGSIPILGWLFRSTKEEHTRQEIIVFLTPRVVDAPEAIEDDARKIKATVDTMGVWDSSWSNSRLADPVPEKFRKHLIDLGHKTVSPPSAPLSGYLSNLNDEYFTTNTESAARSGTEIDGDEPADEPRFPYTRYGEPQDTSKYPYVHFTEGDYTRHFKPLPDGVIMPAAANEKSEKPEVTEESVADDASEPAVFTQPESAAAEPSEPEIPASEAQDSQNI